MSKVLNLTPRTFVQKFLISPPVESKSLGGGMPPRDFDSTGGEIKNFCTKVLGQRLRTFDKKFLIFDLKKVLKTYNRLYIASWKSLDSSA